MILQAGRHLACRLLDRLEQPAIRAGYAGLRRLRFSFFLDEPKQADPALSRLQPKALEFSPYS
jgi:hypothetical protein